MAEIDKDFKRVFSFELLLHRIENTKSENFQYTKILLEKTLTGLNSQGKIDINYNESGYDYIVTPVNGCDPDLVKKLTQARKIFKALAIEMGQARSDVTTRSWMDGQILEKCHLIDAVVYPIANAQSLLDMSVTLSDMADQIRAGAQSGDDE